MRRALAEAALRAAAAATTAAPASSSSSLRGGKTALVANLLSVSSSIDAASAAAIFARALSSAAASSSASAVAAAAEAEPRRSSRDSSKSGERPARRPRRRQNDGGSTSGSGGGRSNRSRDNDGFSGSSRSGFAVTYDQYGDAIPPAVINHAGEGAPGWQLLGEEPEISANFWALDATGGRAGGAPEFAALLSSDAKDAMWAAYKGRGLSTSAIAKLFGIREQRAAAILALRAAEEEMDEVSKGKNDDNNEEVALLFEGGVDGRGAVRAALDAAAARVALVERRRLEGIGQAVAPEDAAAEGAEEKGEEEGEEGEGEKKKSLAESMADDADAEVSAELSADAAAGAALRDVPSSSPSASKKSVLAAGAAVEVVQGIWPCDRLRGGGERAVAPLPRYPAFELLLEGSSGGRKARPNAAASNNDDEETPAESEVPAAERARALEAEAAAVREFKARLAFNAGSPAAARAVLGAGGDESTAVVVAARRSVSRAAVAPRRPEGGWPLLVKPLASSGKGKGGRQTKEKPFVALPDGTRRPLSAEERAALKRATPLPRRRGAEAHDAGALAAECDADFFPLEKLPNDVLVSVFAEAKNPTWVRHTFPLVCKDWAALYLTKGASPLHETLDLNFNKEAEAAAARAGRGRRGPVAGARGRRPVVHASRVISWAQERAGSVPKLRVTGDSSEAFSSEDLRALVAVVGPSLTDISLGYLVRDLCQSLFWESLRTSVVPAGRLRSLFVEGIESDVDESDVEPLAQLAGSLEELVLHFTSRSLAGLPRFPESLCALTELRRLDLSGHDIDEIPAAISSLKKLKDLELRNVYLSSLPKELGELSGLTKLDLQSNRSLGTTLPLDEAFPAELGGMKSLRVLDLRDCGLCTVPSFVGQLKSLESLAFDSNSLSSLPEELGELPALTELNLASNRWGMEVPSDAAFPAELGKMKSLRGLNFSFSPGLRTVPAFVCKLESLESLDLTCCRELSSLPKELGELSGLTKLDLSTNYGLGFTPESEAFPAELGKMKSLRVLDLCSCGLVTVPAFVGKLESLENLDLLENDDLQIDAPLDFLIEGCPHLRKVRLWKGEEGIPWTPESLAHLEAFKAKLRAKNPNARVFLEFSMSSFLHE